ncbi:MAG TPA: nuclease-related domain-containing protein [Dermatophilaceae bacterium]|mgnify:CR=1 FL=1|nr:nuclease-related domain-containing protein [Dermatophilaceae bacterium]
MREVESVAVLCNRLAALAEHDDAVVLHDRVVPGRGGSLASLDHVVCTGDEVLVVETQHVRGRPRRSVEGGLLRARRERLVVGKHDGTPLIAHVLAQVGLVSAALRDAGLHEVAVTGALCFVETEIPWGEFVVDGVLVADPDRLVRHIRRATHGETTVDVAAVAAALRRAFPAQD